MSQKKYIFGTYIKIDMETIDIILVGVVVLVLNAAAYLIGNIKGEKEGYRTGWEVGFNDAVKAVEKAKEVQDSLNKDMTGFDNHG